MISNFFFFFCFSPLSNITPPELQLGCACVADKCKDMHGDCVRGVCACISADSENCDFAKCVEGDDGCLCTPEGTYVSRVPVLCARHYLTF